MQNTNIQWTDHTLNFWWGCTKVSRACKHCYAESVAKVFGKKVFGEVPQWGAGKPRFERLEAARKEALKMQRQAVKADKRPRVFVNSMSDWLDDEVPVSWLAFLLETLAMCPDVDFQLLTKRPENWRNRLVNAECYLAATLQVGSPRWLCEWLKEGKAPANLWIGTTVEDQAVADARIPHLLQIPARVRFLSCEPLVGPIILNQSAEVDIINPMGVRSYTRPLFHPMLHEAKQTKGYTLGPAIDWLIAGGESGGPAEPMHPDWARSLRDQCAAASVPFFFKQWGEWLPVSQMRHIEGEASLARAYKGHKFPDDTLMLRVGVKDAGGLLDGVEHLAFPITR